MESLSQGVVLRSKTAAVIDGKSSHTFRAPNGEVFVMIFLGTETTAGRKGGQINVEAVLRDMGWVRWNSWEDELEDEDGEE